MDCPLCGEICHCHLEPPPTASLRRAEADEMGVPDSDAADPGAWRGELSAKLNRYRSKRRIRPPRYPSLSLPFDAIAPSGSAYAMDSPPTFNPSSDHALALEAMVQTPLTAEPAVPPVANASHDLAAVHPSAKIIEFPRFAWGPPPAPADQLAEPVMDRPRILEVPEEAAPLPALGGIMIEGAEKQQVEKRPGIDLPLQSAPPRLRVLAAGIDGLIVATASILFAYIFWKVAAVRPPQMQIAGLALGFPCLFWALYQYLLIVYAAGSPGLAAAGLELARFDGSATDRRTRRWRVLASYLSAVSLGMGYAWLFLDEDRLCWHDRITHTYLASKKPS
jgi:RDD family